MEIPLLQEIVVIFSLAIAVILAFYRFKVPPIVGFLFTGVLAGPHCLGIIANVEDVDMLATIGIVLLLFTVGMEFSLKKIFEYKRYFFIGGGVQVLLTVLFGTLMGLMLKGSIGESIFLGYILTLSSTAIVLRTLNDKGDSNTPHGRLVTGVLIFQDVVAIPMMLMIPLLAGSSTALDSQVLGKAALGVLILATSLLLAHKLVPSLLHIIAKTRNRELFLLSVITICFAVAWLTSSMGLSLSLGAFLAGLIISESEYRHEAVGDILPFQDLFTSFFFISVGMLLDLKFLIAHPLIIVAAAAAVLLLKCITGAASALTLGFPLRTALLSGIALSQVGEFSFVLAKNGFDHGLGDEYRYQLFLAVSILTMGLTPTLMANSGLLASLGLQLPLPMRLKSGSTAGRNDEQLASSKPLEEHLAIIGFGINGRNLAYAAKEVGIPYVIVDMNPETVKAEALKGEPIFFGDASHPTILEHLHIDKARAVAVVINDFGATRKIIRQIRRINRQIFILVRTHYLQHTSLLYELGASDVIPDEFGSSLEVFTRVLNYFEAPAADIEKIGGDIRSDFYEQFKGHDTYTNMIDELSRGIAHLGVKAYHVDNDSLLAGKTLKDANLRSEYNLTVIAIKRQEQILAKIEAHTVLCPQDVVTVVGAYGDLKKASSLFKRA
jgi:CPA2 family monovalent cation:H+ antiporter-2